MEIPETTGNTPDYWTLERSNDTYGFWIIGKKKEVYLRTYMLEENGEFSAFKLNPKNFTNPIRLLRKGRDKKSVEETVEQEIQKTFEKLQ